MKTLQAVACLGFLVGSSADALPLFAAQSGLTLKIVYDNYVFDDSYKSDWGFSCVIEGPEKTILFDTGRHGDVLLANLKKMSVRPADIDLIVLSHNHNDHTGGLLEFLKHSLDAAVFLPKGTPQSFVEDVQQLVAQVTVVNQPSEICKEATVLGPLGNRIIEQALVLETKKGLVIVTGCSHPGVEAIAADAKRRFKQDIHMILGGTHLLKHSDKDLEAVVDKLHCLDVQNVAPTHCSGDTAIAAFNASFGSSFVKVGVGRVVHIK